MKSRMVLLFILLAVVVSVFLAKSVGLLTPSDGSPQRGGSELAKSANKAPDPKATIKSSPSAAPEYINLEASASEFERKILGASAISNSGGEKLNILERLVDPKYSSKKLSDKFIDEGGLNSVSNLHGINIIKLSLNFNDDGRLHVADLIADSRAFPQGIRQSLSKVCQVSDDAWEINNDQVGDNKSGTVSNGNLKCFYAGGQNNYELIITSGNGD